MLQTNLNGSQRIEDDYGRERVVLRTIDEAFFRVEKRALADSSVIFQSLFRSSNEPQSLNSTRTMEESRSDYDRDNTLKVSEEKAADGLPFIRVATCGKTLDALFQLIYGMARNGLPERNVKDVDHIKDVLLFAHTYGFVSVVDQLCSQLLSDLSIPYKEESNNGSQVNIFALRVYALACRLRRTSLAEAAAYQALRGSVAPSPGNGETMNFPELKELPALDYCRLQEYHTQSGEMVAKVFELEEDGEDCGLPAPYAELTRCFECSEGPAGVAGKAAWWKNYVSRAAQVVREVPRTQVIFSSDFLKETYEVAGKCTGDCRTQIDAKWLALSLVLKERIESALAKVQLTFDAEDDTREERGKVPKLYNIISGNE